jgi:hypothetical protein
MRNLLWIGAAVVATLAVVAFSKGPTTNAVPLSQQETPAAWCIRHLADGCDLRLLPNNN